MKKLTLISLLAATLSLSACAATSAGVKKGDERNLSRSINDVSVERLIGVRLKRENKSAFKEVEVEVAQGIALLAGHVGTAEERIQAERIAWSAPHIIEVGNEIMVGDSPVGFSRGTKDTVLGTSVRRRLITASDVKARNVNIEAHNGIVYLLGVARTPEELARITEIASTTNGAREVVSYMTVHEGSAPATSQNFASALPQQGVSPQSVIPYTAPPQASLPLAAAPAQRAVPDFLSQSPQVSPQAALPSVGSAAPIDPLAPYYRDALTGERIELDPNTQTIPFRPTDGLPGGGLAGGVTSNLSKGVTGPISPSLPSSPSLSGALPSTDDLDKYRLGSPGDTVSVIESAPYYIDPDTGAHIPVNYIK